MMNNVDTNRHGFHTALKRAGDPREGALLPVIFFSYS